MTSFPGKLEKTIVAMHGEAGRRWLDGLPRQIAGYEARWDFRSEPPFPNLSYNFAAPGLRSDGTPVVLKVGFADGKGEFRNEIDALRLAAGRGLVELLAGDPAGPAMLLRRALPGDMLINHPDDEEATRIAARVMVAAWRPPPPDDTFPAVSDWGQGFQRMRDRFGGGTGPLPLVLTETAERLFAELETTSADPVVLHGDLHHYNVLRDGEHWVAIDPKGVIGEPAYEIGALMRNRLPDLTDEDGARATLLRRIGIVAEETGLDPARMRRWTVAQAMLSAWWTIEDGGPLDDARDVIRTAELLVRDDD